MFEIPLLPQAEAVAEPHRRQLGRKKKHEEEIKERTEVQQTPKNRLSLSLMGV